MKNNNNTNLLLLHLTVQIDYQLDKYLKPSEISLAQYKILLAVKKGQGGQLKNIADGLGQTKATISQQISKMQKLDLITIRVNPKDRRRHITSLTKTGLKKLESGSKVVNRFKNNLLSGLSKNEKQSLITSLEKLHKVACKAKKCDTIFNI